MSVWRVESALGAFVPWVDDEIYRGDALIAREQGSAGVTCFALDHLGSPRGLTTATGTPLGSGVQSFSTFGAGGSAEGGPLQYTGHERDAALLSLGAATLPDYFHARYYDPDSGRFLSVDPVMDIEEALHEPQRNRYSYVTNNPLKFTDPDGRYRTFYKEKPLWEVGDWSKSPAVSWAFYAQRGLLGLVAGGPLRNLGSLLWNAALGNALRLAQQVRSRPNLRTVSGTGANWWRRIGAPYGAIMWNLNIDVSRSGGVGIAGSSKISGFPSTAMYAYRITDAGLEIDSIFEHSEQTPAWLGNLNWPVQEAPPIFLGRSELGPNDGGKFIMCVDGYCR